MEVRDIAVATSSGVFRGFPDSRSPETRSDRNSSAEEMKCGRWMSACRPAPSPTYRVGYWKPLAQIVRIPEARFDACGLKITHHLSMLIVTSATVNENILKHDLLLIHPTDFADFHNLA